MAAAEEDPECWGRTLETWPEVARASSRLRPPSTLPSKQEESDAAPSLEDLLPWVREAFGEEFVEVQFPSQALVPQPATARPTRTTLRLEQVVQDAVQKGGLKTPPSINLKSAEPKGIRQQLDRLMSSLQEQRWSPDGMGAERQPRTIARQNYDIFKNPFGAADEFTLATKKAERRLNSKRNQESSKESSQDPTMPVRRRKASDTPRKPKSEIVRGQKLERLDYLHTCRGTMGEARFAMERQRLEMQADLRSAEKYSVEEKPKQARCAFSAQTRGGKVSPWDPDLAQALFRPATAPEPRPKGTPEPGHSTSPALETSSPAIRATDASDTGDTVARTFRFASQCAAKRMPMPTLGTFALPAGAGEGSPREGGAARELNVPNWALGDQLLLALTASPLKENMAMLETGDFRGNRITNEGLAAVVATLGPYLEKLDLSANAFDSRGVEAFQSFVPEAGHLTDIDMSSNHLSDKSVSKLCLQLSQYCPHLWRLRLSDVGIGYDADTGGALGILLVAMPKLRLLDVSFNMLGGQGAIAFVKGLQSSRLRCLDLSWNSLGKGPHCKSVAEELATAVSVVETLQHLDISFNCLQVQEMDILAKAVRSSRHIWGIHVDGNAAYVDINGVLTAMPVGYLPEDDARPKPARSSSKKGKAGKKAKQKSKDSADAEICVAGTLLTPGELQARLQALQWHLRLSDLSEEYQKKADEEEKEQLKEKTRSIASIGGTLSLSLFSKDKDADDDNSRIPMSLPEIIRRRPPGEALSPRSQNEMLQSLALETKPEVTASLKAKTAGRTHGELYLHCGKEGLNSKHTNCRLCNEWVKVEFEVLTDDLVVDLPLPGVETPAFEVCVFLSLDNFSQALPLEFKDGSWTGTRFLPPAERMFAVFQIAGKLCVHQRLPARALQQPLEIPLWSPDGDGQTETAIVGEINVVRLGSLALGYCNDVETSQGARVLCTCAEAATAVSKSLNASRSGSRYF